MWVCNECNEKIEDQFEECWKCGDAKTGTEKIIKSSDETEKTTQTKLKNDKINEKENKYPTLKIIAGIYRGFAWIFGVGAIIAIFYGIWLLGDYGTEDLGTIIIVYSIAGGFFSIISLLAISEGINLFVNIANDLNELKRGNKNE